MSPGKQTDIGNPPPMNRIVLINRGFFVICFVEQIKVALALLSPVTLLELYSHIWLLGLLLSDPDYLIAFPAFSRTLLKGIFEFKASFLSCTKTLTDATRQKELVLSCSSPRENVLKGS